MITTTTMNDNDEWWEKEQQKQKEFWDWFNRMNREIEGDDYVDIGTK